MRWPYRNSLNLVVIKLAQRNAAGGHADASLCTKLGCFEMHIGPYLSLTGRLLPFAAVLQLSARNAVWLLAGHDDSIRRLHDEGIETHSFATLEGKNARA